MHITYVIHFHASMLYKLRYGTCVPCVYVFHIHVVYNTTHNMLHISSLIPPPILLILSLQRKGGRMVKARTCYVLDFEVLEGSTPSLSVRSIGSLLAQPKNKTVE
jgi:hypothetical protein